jgi:hypothetical protein
MASMSKRIIPPLQHICANAGYTDIFKKFIFEIEEHPARLDELRSRAVSGRVESVSVPNALKM